MAVEQEAKKAAEAKAKAAAIAAGGTAGLGMLGGRFKPTGDPLSRGVDAEAGANPLLAGGAGVESAVTTADAPGGGDGSAGADGAGGAGGTSDAGDTGATDPAADGGIGRDRMPGAMEAADGGAPETTVHKIEAMAGAEELSPEEQAIQGLEGVGGPGDEDRKAFIDEDTDTAALAEGRAEPPVSTRDEPA